MKEIELLRHSQRISKIATWIWTVESGAIECSDELFEMLGYEVDSAKFDRDFYISNIHPDDRTKFEAVIAQSLDNHLVELFEYRVFNSTDYMLWIEQRVVILQDEAGTPQYLMGVCQDITTKKMEELDLLQKSQMLQLILDNAPIGIWAQDTKGRIIAANKAFCDALDITKEEILSVNHYAEIDTGEKAIRVNSIASDTSALKEDGPHYTNVNMVLADGVSHELEIIKVRVLDSEDKVSGLVGLSTDISQRKIAEENLKYLAHHDGLTGLANRNYFVDQLRKTFALARRQKNHGALLFFDCDHFKAINDSLGHQTGDKILKLIGERLTENIRVEDEVARLGGDEFVIMLVNIGEDQRVAAERAQSIAEKLREIILLPYELDGSFHYLTPSVGVSLFPQEEQTADDVMKHADTAMYRAKDAGRNTIRFFMPSMQQEVELRLRTQKELKRAISADELELHYQPQISATEGVTGVEALIRWNHPERGMVFPDGFIDIAEESSLIVPMGDWVLRNGLEQFKRWQTEGLNLGTLAINVSPKQFYQDTFVDYVKGLLNELEMSGDMLELELTENLLLEQTAKTVSKIEALKEVGVLFSIDDFGTGYSSMAYLKQLPLDRLKIDKSFVSDIMTNVNDAHIVKTIIGMAHNLGLELIAEGVETRDEMDFLLENGCYHYQGYYFSRPIAACKIIEFCESYEPVLS